MTYLRKRGMLALAHVLVCAGFLWALYPLPVTGIETVRGKVTEFKSCGRSCDYGIRIGEVVLACSVDPIGPSYRCPELYKPGQEATATYYRMRTVISTLFGSSGNAILIKFEQGPQLTQVNTPDSIADKYAWGSVLPIVMFAMLFLMLCKLPSFRKPK